MEVCTIYCRGLIHSDECNFTGKKGVQAVVNAENKNITLLYQQNNGEPTAVIASFSPSKLK